MKLTCILRSLYSAQNCDSIIFSRFSSSDNWNAVKIGSVLKNKNKNKSFNVSKPHFLCRKNKNKSILSFGTELFYNWKTKTLVWKVSLQNLLYLTWIPKYLLFFLFTVMLLSKFSVFWIWWKFNNMFVTDAR